MNAISPSNLARAALRITINPQQEAPQKAAPTVRIIAEPMPWPDLKTQPQKRASLRRTWRCFTEDGVLLVEDTTQPFADGAAALLLNGHATPDATALGEQPDASTVWARKANSLRRLSGTPSFRPSTYVNLALLHGEIERLVKKPNFVYW